MSRYTSSSFIQPLLVSALAVPTESAEGWRNQAAYVCNLLSDTVSVIDIKNNTLVKNINVGKFPVFSLVCPHDQRKLIVSLHNYKRTKSEDLLVLVDLETGRVIKSISYPGVTIPSGIMYDGKRDTLYVADENDQGYIHVHDGKTLKLLGSLPAGRATVHLDISSDGRYLAATNRFSADLYVYDLDKPLSAQKGISIALGHPQKCHPFDVKFSGNPDICYVTDFNTGELLVVDIAGRSVTDRLKVGSRLFGMALDKAENTAYVCDLNKNSIYTIDLGSKRLVGEITGLEGMSSHCAINEKEHQLVASCQGGSVGGAVHIIDLETKEVTATIVDEKIQGSIGVTIDA